MGSPQGGTMGSGTSGKPTNTIRLNKIRTKKSSLMHKLRAFKQVHQ